MASEPTFAQHQAMEPAVQANMGRIYMYRPSSFAGAMLSPVVKVDGVDTSDMGSGDYFYVDRPAGTYNISATTEKTEGVDVPVVAGQTVYVRFHVSMGLFVGHVTPEIVDAAKGSAEITECEFSGTDAPAPMPAPAPMASAAPAPMAPAPMAPAPMTPAAPAAAPAPATTPKM
ncbi:MAG TPA: DUF2846 domain-containing protein [Rhizomicrobium sp.]|jgi:hypothetical protein|nr:DUF2846 domain-containing protein [Rhizomicrobium sp.]